MFCIQVPTSEISCPLKKSWKLRWRRARRVTGKRLGEEPAVSAVGCVIVLEFFVRKAESSWMLPYAMRMNRPAGDETGTYQFLMRCIAGGLEGRTEMH